MADNMTATELASVPTYREGTGRVVFAGWLEDDGTGTSGFRVVIEFPNGPPDLPFSTVWEQTPVRLTVVE